MSSANIAVAVSGGGRSLANLIDFEQKGSASFHVRCVISSKPDCTGVAIARAAGLDVFCHKFPLAPDPGLNHELQSFLESHNVSWVVLAGFLRPLPILAEWRSRIINIHPSLLPKFGGKGMYGSHVHKAVIAARESTSGATVHFVNERYDDGAIIAQISTDVDPADEHGTLAERVFAGECILYPQVINKLIEGELPLSDGRIFQMSMNNG